MTHNDIKDLLPCYALDALGPLDRLEVRAHLEVCQSCEETLREYTESAGDLAITVAPEVPGRGLKLRLMEEVAGGGQTLPIGVRNGRWRISRSAAALAGAAVLFLGGLAGFVTSRAAVEVEVLPEVMSLLSSPNVNAITMTSTGADPDASGRVFLPPDGESAAVIMTGLDDPGDGAYQLAMVLGGEMVTLRTFEPDRSGVAIVLIKRNLESLDRVIVTYEPSSGSGTTGRTILRSR